MNKLGPYKKYIIAAAVIQAIVVVVVGFVLFKTKATEATLEQSTQEKPGVEEPLKGNN